MSEGSLVLQVGVRYYVQVTALNAAGINGSLAGPAVRILEGGRGLSTVGTTFVVASGIIVLAVSLYLLGYLFFRRRCVSMLAKPLFNIPRVSVTLMAH